MYILAGSDISKISNTVNSSIKKYSFQTMNFNLTEENFSEILANLNTPSLFGDRVLLIVDITETDNDLSEKFIENAKEFKDLYVIYQKKLDSRTKLAKYLISNKALIYDEEIEATSPFKFGELVLNQKIKEAYEELNTLEKNEVDYVSIYSGIVTACRNLLNFSFETSTKKSIFPKSIPFFQALSKKYSQEDIKKIYGLLAENDLKFKRGEITDEMMVLSSMNYILNYGNNK